MFIKSFSLFLSLLPLQQFFVFRNIWQTNQVWSNRPSLVSLTFNKSKFLHWDLHLLWASTVYVCFFLATSRTAKFRADNNFTPTVEDVKSLSSFAVKVSFTSNFPLPRDILWPAPSSLDLLQNCDSCIHNWINKRMACSFPVSITFR